MTHSKSFHAAFLTYVWIPLALLLSFLALAPESVSARSLLQEDTISSQCYAVADERALAPTNGDTLVQVNRMTGSTSIIGLTGTTGIEAAAFGPSRTLYATDFGQLGKLNLTTGVFSAVGSPFGTARGSDGNVSLNDVDSLAYQLSGGIFFGVQRRSGLTDLLFAIDPVTGALIADYFGSGIDYLEVPIIADEAGNQLDDVDEITFDPVTGVMYAAINEGGTGGILATLDPTTGVATRIATFRYAPGQTLAGEVIDDIEAISFYNDGTMYASVGDNGPDANDKNRFFRINPTTANGVLIGPFPIGPKDYEALGCLTAEAFIHLEKSTNGPGQTPEDADEPTGPQIQAGDTVNWTYVFTNTGTITLTNLSLSDDQIGTIGPSGASNCPSNGSTLAPGESITCTATGVAQAGQYANIGAVVGQVELGLATVTDTDPSHYFGLNPAITIEKSTNGQDADDPDSADVPVLVPGDPVVWTYDVTNVGNVAVAQADIRVTDNVPGVNPVFDSVKSGNTDNFLEPGEVWTYRAEGTALDLTMTSLPNLVADSCANADGSVPGSTAYTNLGTVTVPGDTDTDPSSYCNPPHAITIEKSTNGQDADDPDGADVPVLVPGDPVVWTYDVTNVGSVAVAQADIRVTDNVPGVNPVFDSVKSGNTDNFLEPGEVWTYREGTAWT